MRGYEFDKEVSDEPIENTITVVSYNPNVMNTAQDFMEKLGLE